MATVTAALLAVLALVAAPLGATAHGFVVEPRARNLVRNWQSCPHCVNGGGPWPTSGEGRLTWPRYKAPVCGDSSLNSPGSPVKVYKSGGEIEISVFITAQHGGRHVFRLCPRADVSEGCLDTHTLQRADGKGAYSWTPTNGGDVPGADYRRGSMAGQGGEQYTWRYRLPAGVACDHCVVQWWWTTANSCRVPGAPSYVHSDSGMLSCTDDGPFPEMFWNCIDISIKGGQGGGDGGDDDRTPAQGHSKPGVKHSTHGRHGHTHKGHTHTGHKHGSVRHTGGKARGATKPWRRHCRKGRQGSRCRTLRRAAQKRAALRARLRARRAAQRRGHHH